jgi:hypothetical protein
MGTRRLQASRSSRLTHCRAINESPREGGREGVEEYLDLDP